jgi:hypothetical protein
MSARPRFVLVLEPLPGVDAVRGLRFVLKRLLRDHGMKCISCQVSAQCEPSAGRSFSAEGEGSSHSEGVRPAGSHA